MLFLYVVHYTTQHYSTINATQHSLKYTTQACTAVIVL